MRKVIIALIVLLGLMLASPPAWAGLQEDVAAAVAARDKHDYKTAIKILNDILRVPKLPKEAQGAVLGIRGVFWQEQKEYYRAVSDFSRAIQALPERGEPYNNLAWILATCSDPDFRKPELALKNAQKAAELLKQSPDSLDTLAAAQAANGQFAEAVKTMEKVVAWCEQNQDPQRLEQARKHLESYKAGRPWIDEARRP